jgi:GTPase involved in cell partitioning and DNA repair
LYSHDQCAREISEIMLEDHPISILRELARCLGILHLNPQNSDNLNALRVLNEEHSKRFKSRPDKAILAKFVQYIEELLEATDRTEKETQQDTELTEKIESARQTTSSKRNRKLYSSTTKTGNEEEQEDENEEDVQEKTTPSVTKTSIPSSPYSN